MNLITAVIVDHAIRCSTHDAELECWQQRKRLMELIPLFNRVFSIFDIAQAGEVNIADMDVDQMSTLLPPEVLEVLKSRKLKDFFALFDTAGSGRIDQVQWVDGMCHLVLGEVPVETLQMLNLLSLQAKELKDIKAAVLPTNAGRSASRPEIV